MTIALATLTELQALLRSGGITAVELMKAVLSRIDAVNPDINAVVALDRDMALAAAHEADRRFDEGRQRPLEGIPVTIKDAFDVAGLVSTAGSPSYGDRVPTTDASAVARLRNAGAIVIGKSNVPLFSGDFQAYNAVYGVTNNPFDRSRSPGGSSGGAAAAVATGMSVFELGSDLGGSIRWPAHATGVFGLKPTWGLTSTFGHVPPAPERRLPRDVDLSVAGPIARSAADLEVLLSTLAGPRDPLAPATELAPPRASEPSKLRVAVWLDEPFAPVDDAVRDAVLTAATRLGDAGARIDYTARPDFTFEESFEVYALLNHAIVAAGLPDAVRDKLAASASQFAAGDLSHRALQARGARLSAETYQDILKRRQALKRRWAQFFERFDVLLCAPAPVAAIRHDHNPRFHVRTIEVNGETRPYFDFLMWSSLATISHLPAAVAPVMRDPRGLPCGVQIIGPEYEDRTVIAVACMLETLGCCFIAPPIA
ncbi:MAG: amidase [Beijerinckiaceae bacterium]|nr:amidase [Beijerinckiaceae bacterium]